MENRGVQLRFLFPEEAAALLQPDRAAGFDPRDTLVLLRGALPRDLPFRLEEAGWTCVNSARSAALANDKLETFRFFSAFGYRLPATIDAETVDAASELAAESAFPSPPWILKPRFGSRGEGVRLMSGAAELDAFLAAKDSGEFILQEYIAECEGTDIRVFFAAGRVIASAVRRAPAGSVVSNACSGGAMQKAPSHDPLVQEAERLALEMGNLAGLYYGAADFLPSMNGNGTAEPVLCELNAAPGFEELEKQCGIDVAGPLAAAIADYPRAKL